MRTFKEFRAFGKNSVLRMGAMTVPYALPVVAAIAQNGWSFN